MKLFITGGCGFIGSNFIRHILRAKTDIEIVNYDKLTYCGNENSLKDIVSDPRYTFIKGDICDKKLLDEVLGEDIDIVINFAAESHVDRSIKYPDEFIKTNITGVKTLLDRAKDISLTRFVQIGTDEVYGSVTSGFSKEDDKLEPSSPYSASKAAGDLLALSYFTTYGIPVIVTRSSNNYGPYQFPEKVIPLFITNLLGDGKIPVYGDGSNVRDWIYVEDNCSALISVLENGIPGEIYNIGGGNQISNVSLAGTLLDTMEKNNDCIEYVNDRPGHDKRYALDSSKTRTLGWDVAMDFSKGIEATVKWYADNEWWWRPIKENAEIIKW